MTLWELFAALSFLVIALGLFLGRPRVDSTHTSGAVALLIVAAVVCFWAGYGVYVLVRWFSTP